jgi:hypothetical protein
MNNPLFDVFPADSGGLTVDLERRACERTAPLDPEATAILRDPLSKSEHTVKVVDKSRGGLRVLLDDEAHPSIGNVVAVDFEGTVRPAAVRWALAKRHRGWRIALQWLD